MEHPSTRKLQEWPWQWIPRYIPRVISRVLLPLGNMEAHGIIPLGTDTLIPEALAESLAEPLNAVIAPALPYGLTSSLRHYPGSMNLPKTLYRKFLQHLLTDLHNLGLQEIIVLNGHGGQTEQVHAAARTVHLTFKTRIIVLQWWEITEPSVDLENIMGPPGGHAGTYETSMIQAINPDWLHPELLPETVHAPRQQGITAYPFPGSIMQLADETLRILPENTSRQVFNRVREGILKSIESILQSWQNLPT